MLDLNSILEGRLRWTGVEDISANVGFYPSSASVEYKDDLGRTKIAGYCLRQQYYNWCGVPATNPPDLAALLKMHLGNVIHDAISELLSRSPAFLGAEKRMYRPYNEGRPSVSGRVDLFLFDEIAALPVIGEVKTGGGYFFERYTTKGTKSEPPRPRDGDVCQILTYIDFYGQFGVEQGILFYVDRASGYTKQYVVRMDSDGSAFIQSDEIAEYWRHINIGAIDARWARLQAHLEAAELPKRDFHLQYPNEMIVQMYEEGELNRTDTPKVKKQIAAGYDEEQPLLVKGDWQCGFCKFKDLCYGREWDDSFKVEEVARPFKLSPELSRRVAKGNALADAQQEVVDIL